MQYIYSKSASESSLNIDGENYKYLFKARRHKINDLIYFRNLKDNFIYEYRVDTISKREANLMLNTKEDKFIGSSKKLHIGWCLVDPKTIEKQLPYLNELGVEEITFIYADYSQKNFKVNFEKCEKILINSSQQCGRSSLMKLNEINSLSDFLKKYPNSYALDFSSNRIENSEDIQNVIIGCEGGFSKDERELLSDDKVFGLNSTLILRSETAVTTIAAKILV